MQKMDIDVIVVAIFSFPRPLGEGWGEGRACNTAKAVIETEPMLYFPLIPAFFPRGRRDVYPYIPSGFGRVFGDVAIYSLSFRGMVKVIMLVSATR